jgi:hypothetical protein
MPDHKRIALGKLEDPELRASLCRVYQAIVTRPWPTLPALAPGGPSISMVGPYPHSRFSAVLGTQIAPEFVPLGDYATLHRAEGFGP